MTTEPESMPRLSGTLPGPRSPVRCQSCAASAELGAELSRWREHDERDRPERVVVVLCRECSKRLIGPHPRLYGELGPCEPFPGAMTICLDCRHRDGVRCSHPDARANGGPGVGVLIAEPIRCHVTRSPRRLSGFVTLWRLPAHGCVQHGLAQKEGGS